MSTSAFAGPGLGRRIPIGGLLLGAWVVVSAILIAHGGLQSPHAFVHRAVPVLLVPLAAWLFFSQRYELTLTLLLLYLGLLDGVVKLTSGSTIATLGRDVLLYSITLGAIARLILRKRKIELPLVVGLVMAWIAVCLMQLANPADASLVHALAALRQHIEFVPLFFFGYFVLRTRRRLAVFFFLLVLIGAANGVASLIQAQLTPHQLGAWGPGYHALEDPTSTTYGIARVFYSGQSAYVRPPALGGEDGFGGIVGLIALPCGIALMTSSRRSLRSASLLLPGIIFTITAVVTSQSRFAVIGALLTVFAYLALTMTSRRGFIVLAVVAVVVAMGYYAASSFVSTNANRYSTITPAHVFDTAGSARAGSLAIIPQYLLDYPLGAGIGSVGPAQGVIGGSARGRGLNGETEFTFLIVETGIPGLLIMIALFTAALRAGFTMRRIADPELQRLLMALTAVLVGLFAAWFVEAVTSDSPGSPSLWITAGGIAYWYSEVRAGRLPLRRGWLEAAQRA